jgi:class 3 adenylate cyclase
MGINSGPVDEVLDVDERRNVTGAGINLAQRVMDCGDAGHILLSRRVADDLAQYSEWQPCLHDLDSVEVKHGVRVALANFFGEVSVIPPTC